MLNMAVGNTRHIRDSRQKTIPDRWEFDMLKNLGLVGWGGQK